MAVWSSSTDYSKTIGLTFIIAGALLSPCLSAPAADNHNYWWNKPCGENVRNLRHARSIHDDLLHIRKQLGVFVRHFKIQNNSIHSLYNNDPTKFTLPITKIKWLRLKNMLKSIGPLTNLENSLPEFYKAFQQFGASAEVISNMEIKTNSVSKAFSAEKRKKTYVNVTKQIQGIMCEVYEVLIEKYGKQPQILTLPETKIPLQKLKVTDLTGSRMIDINYFKKLGAFLKQLQKVLRRRGKNVNNNKNKKSANLVKPKSRTMNSVKNDKKTKKVNKH